MAVENNSKFYILAHIIKSVFKCHMEAKSPIKNKKYKLIMYHQDGMPCNEKEALPMQWWIPMAKAPLSLLLQANRWISSRVNSSHHFLQCGISNYRKQQSTVSD